MTLETADCVSCTDSTAPNRWERAYQAFQTPEQELNKFVERLRSIGADRWDRRAQGVVRSS